MRAALLLPLLALPAGCGDRTPAPAPEESPRPRVLVVGWDGADFDWLDPLLAEGRLPHLAGLIARGRTARLASTRIPISSAAWTAAVTGKGPGETGVFDFFETVPGTYDVTLTSSRSNAAPPLWRILSAQGLTSIVFGVPLTYPPEPILGTLVAGMLSPFDAQYAYPPEKTDELRARGFVPDLDVWIEDREVSPEEVERQLAIKEEVLVELLAEDDWSFAMVVFKSLDVVAHLAYGEDLAAHVQPVVESLDRILGRLLETVGPETDVLLVSDHGFREFESGFNLHRWLVERGFSRLVEGATPPAPVEGPLGLRERADLLACRAGMDWSATRAFAEKCEGTFGAIRLNVRGREPEGSVAPEDTPALIAELQEALGEVRYQGEPLLVRSWPGAELYPGPHRAEVPDLLFEVSPSCQVFNDPHERRIAGRYDPPVPDHDYHGILVAAGPSIAPSPDRGDASLLDLAPTVLHLLGRPVHAEMQGAVLLELVRDPTAPVVVPEGEALGRRSDPGRPFTDAEIEELRERLEPLGYGR